MNINATILIQAFNFFIVYWMLRLFLFKPIIAIIDYENAEEKSLRNIIDQQQKSLEIQEKERQRHWYVCQEYFNIHRPYNAISKFSTIDIITDLSSVSELPTDEIAQIITEVRITIEDKIKHVH